MSNAMCYICIVDMAEYNNLLLDQALNKRNIVLVLELHQQTKLSYFFPIEQQKYENQRNNQLLLMMLNNPHGLYQKNDEGSYVDSLIIKKG